jgi:hypothetical protein
MPRTATAHGTYRAYLRCRQRPEGACEACQAAKRERSAKVSTSADARVIRESPIIPAAPAPNPEPDEKSAPAPTNDDGHVSRLEVLKEMLQDSRDLVVRLKRTDPARAYLQLREQREIVREIAELQGNGQVKGVTLADQLADARARRLAAPAAS